MKIILVGTAYPLRGGIAHFFALLYHHLRGRHDVEIVTFSRQYPRLLFPGTSQTEQESESIVVPSLPLIDSLNPLSWVRAARYIAQQRPALVVFKYWLPFFGPCFGMIARLVHRWSQARVVFICDNVIPHERRPGDRFFTSFAFRAADFFIVQSKAVEADLRAFRPAARYRLVPHPIYEIFGTPGPKAEARGRLGISADERVILFFGYVRPYKGLMTLIDATAKAIKELSLTLLIVGEFYDDPQKYRRRIQDLGLTGAARIYDQYIPTDRVGHFFHACDVVVLPYRSATQSGIVQIAYQFDKPVIATNVGGLAEVVLDGATGLVVPADNAAQLAEAIVRFYRDGLEERFVGNVRTEKRKYSWDAMVEALEEIHNAGTAI